MCCVPMHRSFIHLICISLYCRCCFSWAAIWIALNVCFVLYVWRKRLKSVFIVFCFHFISMKFNSINKAKERKRKRDIENVSKTDLPGKPIKNQNKHIYFSLSLILCVFLLFICFIFSYIFYFLFYFLFLFYLITICDGVAGCLFRLSLYWFNELHVFCGIVMWCAV